MVIDQWPAAAAEGLTTDTLRRGAYPAHPEHRRGQLSPTDSARRSAPSSRPGGDRPRRTRFNAWSTSRGRARGRPRRGCEEGRGGVERADEGSDRARRATVRAGGEALVPPPLVMEFSMMLGL